MKINKSTALDWSSGHLRCCKTPRRTNACKTRPQRQRQTQREKERGKRDRKRERERDPASERVMTLCLQGPRLRPINIPWLPSRLTFFGGVRGGGPSGMSISLHLGPTQPVHQVQEKSVLWQLALPHLHSTSDQSICETARPEAFQQVLNVGA